MPTQLVQPMIKAPRGELHSWGVDYIRVTAKNDAGKKAILLTWAKLRTQLERLGDNLKKGGMQGFKGETIGPVFYGRKEGIFMLQVSGGLADTVFPTLPWAELHPTRIDLQVTLQLPEDNQLVAAYLGEARARPFTEQGKEPDPKQRLEHPYGAGDTLYIGGRSSPRFGRIYDKARESKDDRYARCWRYECEFKDPVARNIVNDLLAQESLDRGVASLLRGQFAAWGIDIELPVAARRIAGSIGRREFDSERSLKWLAEQVAPSIERLLATVERETILEALRLADRPEEALPTITKQWLQETGQEAPQTPQKGGIMEVLTRRW